MQARLCHDRGGGTPSVIISDIHSTAAILRAAQEASPDSFYHANKLLLYFDGVWMGGGVWTRIRLNGEG